MTVWNRFAFVHYKNAEACRRAHDKADGLKVRGRTIMVTYARRKTDQAPVTGKQTDRVKGQCDTLLKHVCLIFIKIYCRCIYRSCIGKRS